MVSRGTEGGSFSVLSSTTAVVFDAGVFQGTEMIFTALPSTDSVADIDSSCARIGSRSPCSVMIYRNLRGRVIEPVI